MTDESIPTIAPEVIQADRNDVYRLLADKAFTTRRTINGQPVFQSVVPYNDVVEAFARHRLAFASPAEPAPGAGGGIKALPSETVVAVTEAILREAREQGADSPVDYGDAEQLALAAIGAMPTPSLPAGREAIAKIIYDNCGGAMILLREQSLRAADKILAIGPSVTGSKPHPGFALSTTTDTVKIGRSEKGEAIAEVGTRCRRCGVAAPKAFAAECDRPECEYRTALPTQGPAS